MRHVLTMTASSSVGLVAIFVVDAVSLFYIAQLGQPELTAAVGYASTLLFFTLSLCIGLSIAASTLTAQALGRGDREGAKQTASTSLVIMFVAASALAALLFPLLGMLTRFLGAKGLAASEAVVFMQIALPSVPLLGVGICLGGLLRAVGDAKRGMWVTLFPALALIVLDPLLIFGLNLDIRGAAIAVILARCVMVWIGWRSLTKIHHLLAKPTRETTLRLLKPFLAIGIPAVLTQIATPFANAFVTKSMAQFGDDAVAGWAIISRLTPMAFGVIFALSASVGPIMGQNFGAKRFDRVRSTLNDSLKVTLIYCVAVSLILALFAQTIAHLFDAKGQTYDVVVFFCTFIASSFIFNGMNFVSNAAFNSLGFAFYSTMINWGRSTLGVIPFVWLGGHWYGARGVMVGYGLGAVLTGLIAIWLCYRVVGRVQAKSLVKIPHP